MTHHQAQQYQQLLRECLPDHVTEIREQNGRHYLTWSKPTTVAEARVAQGLLWQVLGIQGNDAA